MRGNLQSWARIPAGQKQRSNSLALLLGFFSLPRGRYSPTGPFAANSTVRLGTGGPRCCKPHVPGGTDLALRRRGRCRYLSVSHRHLESKVLSLKELQPLQQKSPDLEPLEVLPTQTPPGLPDGGIRERFLESVHELYVPREGDLSFWPSVFLGKQETERVPDTLPASGTSSISRRLQVLVHRPSTRQAPWEVSSCSLCDEDGT